MEVSVTIALITALATIFTTIIANKGTQSLTDNKITELSNELKTTSANNQAINELKFAELKKDVAVLSSRVDKHNNLIERTSVLERDNKTAFNKIEEINEKLQRLGDK